MNHGRLAGKVAWISGAASGIGEATAQLFAEEGASVAVVGLSVEACKPVVNRINAAQAGGGGCAVALACDVSDDAQVQKSIEQAVSQFGGLDIVVNNAGIVHVGLLHEHTQQQWDHVMAVNVRSIYSSTRHALPHLRTAGRGYVVNIGSISSFVGQARTPAYTTSKHAVLGLTRSIALDYAVDGVRCNCICPGITDTPMLREHLEATGDADAALAQRLRRVAMGTALSPRDVARAALYFSCEDSVGITGTSLVVDCGYLAAAEWQRDGKTAFMD